MQLNEKVEGVIQQPRRIPHATQPKLKKTLDALKAQDIIADVDKPTEWVSNIVIVEKKNGSWRLCLNPKPLNEAIKRERHNILSHCTIVCLTHRGVESNFYACPSVFLQRAKLCKNETKRSLVT